MVLYTAAAPSSVPRANPAGYARDAPSPVNFITPLSLISLSAPAQASCRPPCQTIARRLITGCSSCP